MNIDNIVQVRIRNGDIISVGTNSFMYGKTSIVTGLFSLGYGLRTIVANITSNKSSVTEDLVDA